MTRLLFFSKIALWVISAALVIEGFLYPVSFERPLPAAAMHPDSGHCYIANVYTIYPYLWGNSADASLLLLENGKAVGPRDDLHTNIREQGRGRFSRWDQQIYFSASDNSDPRTNGRHYTIHFEWIASLWCIAGLAFAMVLLYAATIETLLRRLEALHPAWLSAFVLIIAAGFRFWIWWHNYPATFGGHVVYGMPFSDGRGWDTFAKEFSLGYRNDRSVMLWDARRPMFYWLMGPLYALSGPHPAVTIFVKYLFSCVATVLIFDAVRRLAPLPVALLSALYHALLEYDALQSLVTDSDGLAYCFGALSVWAFAVGLQSMLKNLRRTGEPFAPGTAVLRWYFTAGFILAVSNMTRPLTLLAFVLVPLTIGWLLWRRGFKLKLLLRKSVLAGLIIVGAGAILIAPWVARQGLKYGIWSISDNSIQVLVGAADPRFVTWSSKVTDLFLGDVLDLSTKYKFYLAAYKEAREKHPDFYLQNVRHHLRLAFEAVKPPAWILIASIMCAFVAAFAKTVALRRSLVRLIPSALVCALLLSATNYGQWWWLVSTLLSFALGLPVLLLAAPIIAGVLIMGSTAIVYERLYYDLHWLAVALAGWGAWALINAPLGGLVLGNLDVPNWGEKWNRVFKATVVSVVALLLLGYGKIAINNLTSPAAIRSSVLSVADELKLIEITRANPACDHFRETFDRLEAFRGALRTGYSIRIPANARISHWSSRFDDRPYDFSFFEVEPPFPTVYGAGTIDPKKFPAASEMVYVGVAKKVRNEPVFEVIDVLTFDAQAKSWQSIGCGERAGSQRHLEDLLSQRNDWAQTGFRGRNG